MRTTAIVSTLVLSAALVAGCGGSGKAAGNHTSSNSTGDYCAELKAAKAQFSSFQSSTPDFSKLDEAMTTFHKLAASAPSAVSPEWKTLDGAFTDLQNALTDAGLKFSDLQTIMQGKMPAGMTTDQMATIGPRLQKTFAELEDPKFQTAATKIEAHAKSACHVDLSTS